MNFWISERTENLVALRWTDMDREEGVGVQEEPDM
jgi:hypothetical protein